MSSDWCTIESDPGVFTELIEAMGVKGAQVEELYALEPELLADLMPVYGLIFLFKWDEKQALQRREVDQSASNVFFANQVITNACATQAILSVLLNRDSDIDIGAALSSFKETVKDFPPEMRGLAIGNSEMIRKAHNSFRRPEGITVADKRSKEIEDAFHFVAFVPIDGRLYELDGLQPGPINHGQCSAQSWIELATPIIQQRIDAYSGSEIRFNLMAVVKDRMNCIQEKIAQLQQSSVNEAQLVELQFKLADEETKRKQWREENARRKHNYIPFLFNLLHSLGTKGDLLGLFASAKQKLRAVQPQTK